MMPEGWKRHELADLVDFRSGGTPSKENLDYWDGAIPWYTARDLKTFRLSSSYHHITEDGAKNGTRLVDPGTILILVRGMTLLKDVPIGIATQRAGFNQDIRALTVHEGIDPVFLGYALISLRNLLMLKVTKSGHGTGRLQTDTLAELSILVPPPKEQGRIVAIIETWDRAIERTEQLIEAKRRLKQGLMQQLLTGKHRFRKFTTTRQLKETKFGRIPVDWDFVHFRKVADINQQSLSKTTDPDHTFFYVDLSAVKEGVIDVPSSKVRFKDSPSRARRVAKRGDLVMATVRPNLRGFALPTLDTTNLVFSTGFAIISPKCIDDSKFLYHSLYSKMISSQLHDFTVGSSYPAITGKEVGQLKLAYPSNPEERSKIGAVLNSQDCEIQQLCRLVNQFRQQKRGLMQKLLTGQVRVKV